MSDEIAVPSGDEDAILGRSVAVREYFGDRYELVARFADSLRDEGELRGLIGPREVARLWERHILNSAAVTPLSRDARSVATSGLALDFPGSSWRFSDRTWTCT